MPCRYPLLCVTILSLAVAAGCEEANKKPNPNSVDSAPGTTSAATRDDENLTLGDVKAETNQAIETAKDYAAQQREIREKEVEERLTKIQKNIDELKQLIAKSGESAETQWRETLGRMEQQIASTRKNLQQERESTTEAWEKLRTNVDSAVMELEKSADTARQQLSRDKSAPDTTKAQPADATSPSSDSNQ